MRRTPTDLEDGEHVPGQIPLPVGPTVLSLFSGYGGLDLAVTAATGGRVVAHAEVNPAACRVLEHRWPEVPNLGDVTAVDWRRDVGPVDVIAGGFPCQDVSLAGRRLGIAHDTRSGLWGHMAAAVDELRPGLVVIENVRGLLSARADHPAHRDVEPCPWCMAGPDDLSLRALGAVLGDLADLGYDAAWRVVSAADVGAAHGRARVFALAWPAAADTRGEASGVGPGLRARRQTAVGWRRPDDGDRKAAADADGDPVRIESVAVAGRGSPPVTGHARAEAAADADGAGGEAWDDPGHDSVGIRVESVGSADAAADAEGDGRHEGWPESAGIVGRPDAAVGGAAADRWGPYGRAVRRWAAVLGRDAPPPVEAVRSGAQRLSPAFVEWLMGLPAGWVCDVPGIGRNDALRLLGNGVVPQQAAAAIVGLLQVVADATAPPASDEAGGAA